MSHFVDIFLLPVCLKGVDGIQFEKRGFKTYLCSLGDSHWLIVGHLSFPTCQKMSIHFSNLPRPNVHLDFNLDVQQPFITHSIFAVYATGGSVVHLSSSL